MLVVLAVSVAQKCCHAQGVKKKIFFLSLLVNSLQCYGKKKISFSSFAQRLFFCLFSHCSCDLNCEKLIYFLLHMYLKSVI